MTGDALCKARIAPKSSAASGATSAAVNANAACGVSAPNATNVSNAKALLLTLRRANRCARVRNENAMMAFEE